VTVKSERVYWVECDEPGCVNSSQPMESASLAIWAAGLRGCRWVQVDLGRWMCPKHAIPPDGERA
jgi:endogenous inhibitor of DNA gyrase (YacG/DUF329 family)